MPVEKNTERMSFYGTAALELELRRLAADDGRELSDYLRWVLERHVWGHRRTPPENGTGPDRAD